MTIPQIEVTEQLVELWEREIVRLENALVEAKKQLGVTREKKRFVTLQYNKGCDYYIDRGAALRNERAIARVFLKDLARKMRKSVVELSDIEQGMIHFDGSDERQYRKALNELVSSPKKDKSE